MMNRHQRGALFLRVWLAGLLVLGAAFAARAAGVTRPAVSITSPTGNSFTNIPVQTYTYGNPGNGNIYSAQPVPAAVVAHSVSQNAGGGSGYENGNPWGLSPFGIGLQAVTGAMVTVAGTAQGKVAVTGVWCQVNGSGWVAATALTSGWAKWGVAVNAQGAGVTTVSSTGGPYTNAYSVQAYAEDANGNFSPTSTISFYAVAADYLTLQTNGAGVISPDRNGSLVPLGQPVSLQAVPAAGSALREWESGGSLAGTNQTFKFTMGMGASYAANFRPTVAVTNLAAGQRVTNLVFTLAGRTAGGVAASNVWGQVNGGGWMAASGSNSNLWVLPVTFNPGTNTVSVYAVDGNGDFSLTNTIAVDGVVVNQLAVQLSGLGAITPNYSNAWLEVGRNYTMMAVPAAGFAFTDWRVVHENTLIIQYLQNNNVVTVTQQVPQVAGVVTNKPTLSFVMPSMGYTTPPIAFTNNGTAYVPLSLSTNTGFLAEFTDVQRPTLSVTAPVNGQRWSNSVFTIQGKASDNWAVANVQYQVNGAGWNPATGTNNWSAGITLTPGTNVIQAFATDLAGNCSLTNTVNVDYVVTAPLQLAVAGLGAITPNYSNAWLAVGQKYTVTAVPAAGFGFSNWSGSVPGGKAALSFTMASNLSLVANFLDVTRPTLAVTNAVNGQRVSNDVFTVMGRAADNWQLAGVQYQLNGGGWTNASGTANWEAALELVPGTNVFQSYALDSTGNASLTNTVNLDYVVVSQLQLSLYGAGTITPNYSNAWLEVGRNYSVTAAPATGWDFENWTDAFSDWLTNATTYQFTMQPGLALVANMGGSAPVIVTPPQNVQTSSGKSFSLSVTATGTGPLGYQWFFPGGEIFGVSDFGLAPMTGDIASAGGATLTFSKASGVLNGNYCVVVTNLFGCATSSLAAVSVVGPPGIVGYTTNVTAFPNGTAQLSVYANGYGQLSYQWMMSGTNLPFQSDSWLSMPGLMAGQYRVVVSNPYGSVISGVMTLVVTNQPVTLSGWKGVVSLGDGTSFLLSFGSNTFSQYSPDTNNDSGVGYYTYANANSDPLSGSAQLTLQYVLPVAVSNQPALSVPLSFVFDPYDASFGAPPAWTNSDSGSGGNDGGAGGIILTGFVLNSASGSVPQAEVATGGTPGTVAVPQLASEQLVTNWGDIQFSTTPSYVPGSWPGHTLRLTPLGGSLVSVYALAGTNFSESFVSTNGKTSPGAVLAGNYSAAAWSPAGAVLLLNSAILSTNVAPEYLQLQFTNSAAGNYEMDVQGTDGSTSVTHGVFGWK